MTNPEKNSQSLEPKRRQELEALVSQVFTHNSRNPLESPVMPNNLWRIVEDLHTLQPQLPAALTKDQVREEFFDGPLYGGIVSKGIDRAIRAIEQYRGQHPRLSIEHPFRAITTLFQTLSPEKWSFMGVDQRSYTGRLAVNGIPYSFDAKQPIITVSTARSNEDGRGAYETATYTWIPHLGQAPTVKYSNGAPEQMPPLVDPTASPAENVSRILQEALHNPSY